MRVFSLLIAGAFLATTAAAQITGSDHDLRGTYGIPGGAGAEICIVCHTPHDTSTGKWAQYGDLWNHAITTQTFSLWGGNTGSFAVAGSLDPKSGLCLSCHDGTVGVGDYANRTGGQTIGGGAQVPGGQWAANDLRGTHPVSVIMSNSRAQLVVGFGPGQFPYYVFGAATNTLRGAGTNTYSIECYTCHDPHNSAGTFGPMLRYSMNASELCQNCHFK